MFSGGLGWSGGVLDTLLHVLKWSGVVWNGLGLSGVVWGGLGSFLQWSGVVWESLGWSGPVSVCFGVVWCGLGSFLHVVRWSGVVCGSELVWARFNML